MRAIEGLHGQSTMEGCRSSVVVKFADSDKEKMQKRGMPMPGAYPFGAPFGGPMVSS
jgi:hypothetical protein